MSITPVNTTPTKPPSVFKEATPSLSKEQLAASIRSEIKRLQHRKQLAAHTSSSQSDSSDNEQASTSSSPMHPSTSSPSQQLSQRSKKDNTPLFTFKQVTHICERMVKERTEQLCDEYDKVLTGKMAEQYEAFLKFNHDQIQRQFSTSEAASYLS